VARWLGWVLAGGCSGEGDGVDEVPEMAWVSTTGPEHCGEILADEVWAADRNPHVVTCHVEINGGTVSIGPGTEVRIGEIKSVTVGNDGPGQLIVAGDEESPVLFTEDVPGARFTSLGFSAAALPDGQRISNAILSGGGRVSFPTVPEVAFRVSGVEVLVENFTIHDTEDYAFELIDGGRFAEGSYGLVSYGNPYAGRAQADVADSVPEDRIDLTGNDLDALIVNGNTIAGEVVWGDIGVPYYNDAGYDVEVDGTAADPALLTLEAGVLVWLGAGYSISVGAYGPGALVVDGTATDPVVVTGAYGDGTEYHDGVSFWDDTVDALSVLDHLDVSYGGNSSWFYGDINLDDASPTITDSFLHDSAEYGLYLAGDSFPVLTNVTFADNPAGDMNE
jgi:hypothetical protein